MVDAEAVSREISSKLRGYDGLTTAKLTECPAILEAIGSADPTETMRQFVAALDRLPDDKYKAALTNALRLDQMLPASLGGHSGRRMLFGMMHSVSEETVKSWEGRAIDTLAQALVAKPSEHIHEIALVFYVENKQIFFKSETRFWIDGPIGSVGNLRIDTRNIRNLGSMHILAGLYQLAPDEAPTALEIYVLFPDNQLPSLAFTIEAPDIFDFSTGYYDRVDLGRPHAAVSILGDEWRPEGSDVPIFDDQSGFMKRFEQPQHGTIYGVAWGY